MFFSNTVHIFRFKYAKKFYKSGWTFIPKYAKIAPTDTKEVKAMKHIATIHTDYKEKFGVPRQSGMVKNISRIVFFEEYRNPDAIKGIEGFSHLWLIWDFSEAHKETWSPTVRPPRLGGNKRVGVFATRSPFRPNPLGLSSVRLINVEITSEGPVLTVEGADMKDGTPIYDIKPYLAYTDSHPDAVGGFADGVLGHRLEVNISDELLSMLEEKNKSTVLELLALDPRPSYKKDTDEPYGMTYGNDNISFVVCEGILTVTEIKKTE